MRNAKTFSKATPYSISNLTRQAVVKGIATVAVGSVIAFVAAFAAPLNAALADQAGAKLKVEVIGAEAKDKDSEAVLEAFKKLMQGLGDKDMTVIGECLSANVIVTDTRSHNLVSGKEQVLEHISKKVIGEGGNVVTKSIVVYHPFINVNGDTAMVSFRAVKELGGDHPAKLESFCSEIFERKDSQWKVLHFQSSWKPYTGKK